MRKVCKRLGIVGILLGIMLFAAGFTFHVTTVETQAAVKNGLRVVKGKTYYYENGKKVKGLVTVKGKLYFFNTKNGAAKKGWKKSADGSKYYFDPKTGAAYTGLKKIRGKYYYFNPETGKTLSGFVKCSDGKTRYFFPKKFTMATGWMQDSNKQRWYFDKKTGAMYTGRKKIGKYYYYFSAKTGAAVKGFVNAANGHKRYFRQNYRMATKWLKAGTGQKRYFSSGNGIMFTGLKKISGKYYYFDPDTGLSQGGFVTINGNKYYFDPSTYVMVTGTKKIDGVTYKFSSGGILIETIGDSSSSDASVTVNFANDPKPVAQTGTKTIKNYLAGALLPVGQALYVWGGGWTDSTRKGVSPTWQSWYVKQNANYDYNNYRDLTTANRVKGLDCSGFVGWASYQVMHNASGSGYGYTVVSGDIGSYYKNTLKWGTVVNQNYLSQTGWKMQPGDIGYDSGHTWIVLGQCADKSAVIVHSTPQAGCQIAGTTTPSGSYNSQAVALAQKYMSMYSGYQKYDYHPSCGNYIRRGNYMRWGSVLSDPDGYKNMTADQILYDLFKR